MRVHHRRDRVFILIAAHTPTHRLDVDAATHSQLHHTVPVVVLQNQRLDVRVDLRERRVVVRRAQVVAEVNRAARVLGENLLFGEVDVVLAGDHEIDVDVAETAAGAQLVVERLVLAAEIAGKS